MAGLLASQGYVAFALTYFGMDGLPETLHRIPLEYFGKALAWLSAEPRVDADRIGVVGCSRGGELALLLGSTYPQLRSVVAYVPSGVVWPGYPSTGGAAWTLAGEDVPFASTLTDAQWDEALAQGRARPDSFDWYLIPLQDEAYADRATIAVEKTRGPIMMISGEDDGLWPSPDLAEFAVRRADARCFEHAVQYLAYAGAGHDIAWPHAPTTVPDSCIRCPARTSTSGDRRRTRRMLARIPGFGCWPTWRRVSVDAHAHTPDRVRPRTGRRYRVAVATVPAGQGPVDQRSA